MPDRDKEQPKVERQPDRTRHGSSTEGTDRDMDETGESRNQGHGHPREERTRSSEAGRTG